MINLTYSSESQDVLTKKAGFNLKDTEELRKLVDRMVRSIIKRYNPNHWLPIEDVAWDCFTTLYMRRFFHKFDISKATKKETYLYNGVSRYLIDQERMVSSRLSCLSLDVCVDGSTSTFADFLDENIADCTSSIESYLEAISVINHEGKTKKKRKFAEILGVGKMELSAYSVLFLSLSGYRNVEIADKFNVAAHCITEFYKKGVDELKESIEFGQFTGDISECVSLLKSCVDTEVESFICPHCKSKNTRFWSSDTWSGVPFYVCRDCGKSFSELTNTPLQKFRNLERLTFIDCCMLWLDKCTIGVMSAKLDIGVDKVKKWVKIFEDYFMGDPKVFVERRLKRWSLVIKEAERRKQEWKK